MEDNFMATINNFPKKKGRPSDNDYLQLRGKAFEMIWEKWGEKTSDSLIKYEKAEEDLGVGAKSVRAIFRDISDISPEITLVAEGVRVGRPTYYHNSCRTASKLKDAIADKCVELIPPNITLACGPGSTVACCTKHLVQAGHYHVIITNNVGIIDQVGGSEISNLFFIGGEYKAGIHGCVGKDTVEGFGKVTSHAVLIGVSGISATGELFVRHSDEIEVVNKIVQSASDTVFIVADVRKLIQVDTWAFIRIPKLSEEKPDLEICLITNPCTFLEKGQDRAREVMEAMKKKNVKVIECGY
jgi:hypothetical protein